MAEASFGPAIDRVAEWGDQFNESFGVSEDRMLSMLGTTGDLLVGLGATADQAATLATEGTELAGILALASGGTVSMTDASERLQAAMVGETDGLKALGIAISAADIEARLLANGQAELTGEARRAAEAQAVLDIAYDQSAGKVQSYADGAFAAMERQNELSATIDTAKVKVGEFLNEGWLKLVEFITEDVMPMWEELQPTVEEAMTAIQEVVQAVLEFVEVLWAEFGDEIMVVVEFWTESVLDRITTAFDIVKGIFELVTALLQGEWGAAWDAFAGIVSSAMGFMWREIERILGLIGGVFSSIWDGITSTVSGAIDALVGFVAGLPGRITSAVAGAFDPIIDGLRSAWNSVAGFLNGIRFTFEGVNMPGPIPDVPGFTVDPIPRIPTFAHGGVVDSPTLALIGEDNRTTPEIVTPEALMRQIVREEAGAGLATAPHVTVFIGNEEFKGYVDTRVDHGMRDLHTSIVAGRR